MAASVERVLRSARRRLAGQLLLERLTRAWVAALAASLAWVLVDPGRWWVAAALLLLASVVAVARTVRDYPTRLAAALELDSRFGLHERTTAAVGLDPGQRDTSVGQAVLADAEAHATRLRTAEQFPLGLPRSARFVAVLGAALACVLLLWHPVADSGWFTADETNPDVASARPGDTASPPAATFPPPNPNAPDKSASERVAELRAELDRLEQQARAGKTSDPKWVAELTAAEDAARTLERESLDRLTRMEAQLRQLERLTREPDFKDGPGRDTASSLASGELEQAAKSLEELARNAAEKPNDPQLQKQVEQLRDELRKAAENKAEREKLDKLIEQAKNEGRDTSGLEQERDRLEGEAKQCKPLGDVADKLEAASRELQKGNGAEAAKELEAAAEKVRGVRGQAKAAGDAQAQLQRAGQLRAEAGPSGLTGTKLGPPIGTGGLSPPSPPSANAGPTPAKEVRPRVPFVDPKGQVSSAGSGDFGGAFTRTDPAKLGKAIQQAAQSAPASVAGQPLGRDDRDAVREFFERLGGK